MVAHVAARADKPDQAGPQDRLECYRRLRRKPRAPSQVVLADRVALLVGAQAAGAGRVVLRLPFALAIVGWLIDGAESHD